MVAAIILKFTSEGISASSKRMSNSSSRARTRFRCFIESQAASSCGDESSDISPGDTPKTAAITFLIRSSINELHKVDWLCFIVADVQRVIFLGFRRTLQRERALIKEI